MDYNSKRWKKVRARILRLDKYRDVVALRFGKRREANTVHHIYPVEEYPEYQWEEWNLISVSSTTHNKMHDRNTNKLIGEGLALMKRTKPGVNWRKNKIKMGTG